MYIDEKVIRDIEANENIVVNKPVQLWTNGAFTLEEVEIHSPAKTLDGVDIPAIDSYKLLVSMNALEKREDEFGEPYNTLLAQVDIEKYTYADGTHKVRMDSYPHYFGSLLTQLTVAVDEWANCRMHGFVDETTHSDLWDKYIDAPAPMDSMDDEMLYDSAFGTQEYAHPVAEFQFMPDGDAPQYEGVAG